MIINFAKFKSANLTLPVKVYNQKTEVLQNCLTLFCVSFPRERKI